MKMYYKKIIALFVLVIAFFIFFQHNLFGKSNIKVLITNATPLMWIDDNKILIEDGNKISEFDVQKKEITQLVYEINPSYGQLKSLFSCLSKNRWILRLKDFNTIDIHISEHDKYALSEHYGWGNINRLDCTPEYDQHEIPSKTVTYKGKTYTLGNEPMLGQLLKKRDGQTYIYSAGNSLLINVFASKYLNSKITFDNLSQITFPAILSDYDKTKNIYLLYVNNNNFDSTEKTWPIQAVWVTIKPDLLISNIFTIPAGPWVRDYTTFDHLTCFSCGCSCYSNMHLYAADGKIYALIWGKAVNKQHKGIYQLIDGKNNLFWQQIANEDIKSELYFSPNGCKVVYQSNNKIKLINVCKISKQ